jgi:hypothetical protein
MIVKKLNGYKKILEELTKKEIKNKLSLDKQNNDGIEKDLKKLDTTNSSHSLIKNGINDLMTGEKSIDDFIALIKNMKK